MAKPNRKTAKTKPETKKASTTKVKPEKAALKAQDDLTQGQVAFCLLQQKLGQADPLPLILNDYDKWRVAISQALQEHATMVKANASKGPVKDA